MKYSFFMLLGVLILRMILLLVCLQFGSDRRIVYTYACNWLVAWRNVGYVVCQNGYGFYVFPCRNSNIYDYVFGASVRAPITTIVLVVELSGYQSDFLPVAISIFTAYLVAEILGNTPIYDSMVDRLVEQTAGNVIKKDFVIAVEKGTFAVGRQIKDIMWPAGALITQVVRENGESLIPDGKTELQAEINLP